MDIYIVTHGEKFNGPNPGMTSQGFNDVYRIRCLLPKRPSLVICGTGLRHIQIARVLGLKPTRYTAVAGGPDSLEVIDGLKMIVLSDGTPVPAEQNTTLTDTTTALHALIVSLPDKSVICAGRPCAIASGAEDAKSAAVYKVCVEEGKISKITEITALGKSEKGTV